MIVAEYVNIFLTFNRPFLITEFASSRWRLHRHLNPQTRPSKPVRMPTINKLPVRCFHVHVQFLCSDWSKFYRWVHAENLCSILNLVYFDSWSWQSFVSTCDVFNFLFPLDVQNEIQLLSGVFCYSWLVCLLGFWLSQSRTSDFGWHRFRFHLA